MLVDEFQDTDLIQWQVLERAFSGYATLILIGDPKQAIYGFRGGDIHTYLKAARTADARYTLGVNWRSDKPLVDSLQTVLQGAALGHSEIVVHDIDAHHDGHRLAGPRTTRRFGCASSNAQRSATTRTLSSRSPDCANTFPPIWPPTSQTCWPAAPPMPVARCSPGTSR
ncbi:uvrD/REP helicase N-terminal domain protein [Mycobacterium xenopi 4042]|uniref:UvrD/REP helicase N-terminal domain protein n=1 Tax=Mycobacterium xenopi 4042 TaxID=1299334 RepID=X8C7X1_MYCXE|nr:uvrD/REP helicase N-terminal domain protein [Mycobacterium xenopi 4042]